ncbi:deoxyribodipyrimidine photo-lyase [soil metagenome]
MTSRVQDERITNLNDKDVTDSDYVLYWLQQSQRAEDNPALEYAVQQANELKKPLLVGFGLMDDYPEANLRHYTFMLEGLKETQAALKRRDINMVVQRGAPDEVAVNLSKHAALLITDRGYLNIQKKWREHVADSAACKVVQVEGDVVVPVNLASDKREYGARTLRPKIHKHLEKFLVDLKPTAVDQSSLGLKVEGVDLSDPVKLAKSLKLEQQVAPVSEFFEGGTSRGKAIIENFLDNKFSDYAEHRNQPQTNDVSHMSKYLHFGQVSPVWLAQAIRHANASQKNIETYVEELVVRRELTMNFVNFTENYDTYNCIPDWAKKTLAEHADDEREYLYTHEEFENAETHDPYWNAAMNEMRYTGYMHNYMRMYWGKKILEWTGTPRHGHDVTLRLNNKYFLDGRDANSFSNVAWVYGNHDRPWQERAVVGKVRYMNAAGLKRKADPDAYVEKVAKMMDQAEHDA